MTATIPRVRMIAGPNGSGKSTIRTLLGPALLGAHINPDVLEANIRQHGHVDLQVYGVTAHRPTRLT